MTGYRLRTDIWVKAQQRLCDRDFLPFTVLRHGDADAGSVILKLLRRGGVADVLAQASLGESGLAWHRPLGADPVAEADADAFIARQAGFDPDIWAIEILDRDGAYRIDGTVLKDY